MEEVKTHLALGQSASIAERLKSQHLEVEQLLVLLAVLQLEDRGVALVFVLWRE